MTSPDKLLGPFTCTVTIAGVEITSKEDWDKVLNKLNELMRENERLAIELDDERIHTRRCAEEVRKALEYLEARPPSIGGKLGVINTGGASSKNDRPKEPHKHSDIPMHATMKAQGLCSPEFPCNQCVSLLHPAKPTEGK